MNRLIKLQFRNLFHSKLFYVCTGLTLLLNVGLSFLSQETSTLKVLPQITDFLSSELSIISVIFISLFSCLDFNEGTTKNIIARGYTRTQLLFSKFITILSGLLIMYLASALLIFIIYLKNGLGYDSSLPYTLINSIVSIIAYTIFYATISFILEKNGTSIIACLFVPNIISLVLGLIDSKLKLNISDFWIDNASTKFLQAKTLPNLTSSLIFYLIYIIIIITIGTQILKKKEIK